VAKNKEGGLHLCRYPTNAARENSGTMESREIDTGDSKMKRSSVYLQSPFPYFGGKSLDCPTQGRENSHREVIYFSPFCIRERERVLNLFEKEI